MAAHAHRRIDTLGTHNTWHNNFTQSADRGAGGSGTVEGTAAPRDRSAGDTTPSTPPACAIDNDKAGASVTLSSNTTSSCVNHEKTLGILICPPKASLNSNALEVYASAST